MDPKVVYWTCALLNMAGVVALALAGVRARRRGDIERHRRCMLAAAALVLLFLLSYPVKLVWLGREEMAQWSSGAVLILRIHETFIFLMLVAGGLAGWRARQLRRTRNATRDPGDPPAPAGVARWHRRAGWTAVVSALLAFLAAAAVLAGMYQRAGLL